MIKKILIILLLTLFGAANTPAQAWSYHTHRKITADAVRLMPETFRREFSGKKSHFLKGSTDPDTLIKDFTSHVYHPDGSATDGLYRIQQLFDKAVELVRSGQDPEATAYVLGLMSHYIADINQPLHTAGRDFDANESEYHSQFERDLNPVLKELQLPTVEYRPVTSVEERVKAMAKEANRYYAEIGAAYRDGRGLAPLREMAERQIAISTKHIIDFWLGVYQAAGRIFNETAAMAKSDESAENWNSKKAEDASSSDTININNASIDALANFFNISQGKAARIVEGRPFNSTYDLAKVDGFNVHFVRRHKDRIRLR
ncbi:MAG: hypothetical protein CVV42_14340 [Candidatus Riflebacteria bacterium HGW-Riflebacteria-2]|jgi:hypothetical protein|nr:MAG: hypothetical protein CVV42_14340 [Candidatus Riflebacteria bacterium HGW-Riflebacteria-2]